MEYYGLGSCNRPVTTSSPVKPWAFFDDQDLAQPVERTRRPWTRNAVRARTSHGSRGEPEPERMVP